MKERTYDTRLMVKCARMYYEENINQEEISHKLQISKSSVSRILSNAREKGIVKIIVDNPLKDEYIYLEKQLEEKYNLREVIVVDSSNDIEEIKKNLGRAAAEYLQRVIKDGQTIGVTWGTTLKEIPQFVRNNRKHDVVFIPMLGGIGETEINIHPNQIALELSRKFKGNCRLLHAPYIVEDLDRKENFIHDKNIQSFFSLFAEIDIAIMGIGSPVLNTSTLLESGYYTLRDIETLEQEGAIADISSLFIDKDGKGDKFEFNERIVGIDLDGIKKIPLKMGIAGYIKKKAAIISAIKGGYINVLVLDDITAKAILKV